MRGHYIAHLDPLNINSANIHMEELDALPGFLDYRKFGAPSPGTLIWTPQNDRTRADLIANNLVGPNLKLDRGEPLMRVLADPGRGCPWWATKPGRPSIGNATN